MGDKKTNPEIFNTAANTSFLVRLRSSEDPEKIVETREFQSIDAFIKHVQRNKVPAGAYYDLRGQDFSGLDMSFANLQGADLRGTNLKGVELELADLTGALLAGANLSKANMSKAQLKKAVFASLPRTPDACRFVIEAKRLGSGLEGARQQAREYVAQLGEERNVVVTDGFRYRAFSCDQDYEPVAYANLVHLKESAPKLFAFLRRP